MKKCLNCGKEVPIDSVFCPFCGSKDIKGDNTCPNCKKVVPTDSVFCPYCGERITAEKTLEPIVTNTESSYAKEKAHLVENEKTDPGIFKRILSWIVLVACFAVALFFFGIVFMIVDYVLNLITDLPTILKIIVYIFGGGTVLSGIIFVPYYLGLPMLIGASEKVCPSRKGLRYLFFGGFVALDYLWAFTNNLLNHHISMSHLAICIFGVMIAYFGKTMSKTF